ncbi:MAG TPA: prolipoprotein diacylglyceryl transferase family protein [Polyangiales bacterium]|nr:prolipoprotein diacylglyceryl transferase family protein [Polyangiales bacterium]
MWSLLFIPWFKLEGIHIPGLPPSIAIQPFGLLVAIGVIWGARVTERRSARLGLRGDLISDFITHVVIIGFVLGHIFDRVFYEPEIILKEPWDLLMPWKSLSSFGGFFGAVAGAFIWKARRKIGVTVPLDQVAYGMPVGWFFGRCGCFVVHDHPGKITDFFLAVDNYQYGNLPVAPRHDLGLYEVFWSAAVIVLFAMLDKKPRPHGFYTGTIAVLYAPFRFMLDFLREADAKYLGLTPGHYSSLLALALGLFVLWRAYKRPVEVAPALLQANTGSETPSTKPAGRKKPRAPTNT